MASERSIAITLANANSTPIESASAPIECKLAAAGARLAGGASLRFGYHAIDMSLNVRRGPRRAQASANGAPITTPKLSGSNHKLGSPWTNRNTTRSNQAPMSETFCMGLERVGGQKESERGQRKKS